MFTADQVWGLAVAADRINEGYFKEQQWGQSDSGESKLLKESNKAMVKYWLRNNNFTEATAEDIAKGQEIRNYFNGFLLKQISGKINEFEQQALRIAQMDEFTNRNMLEFAIVSCLPSVMIRDQSRNELAREVRHSTQLTGNVGDKIQGEIEVVKCYYSKDYDKFRVTAKLVDSFVDFWYNSNLEAGDRISIKAKIKSVRGDNTTQLNFVKRA
jgi:vacuolar-type H+-ATPase subunit I/STV1